MHRQLLSILTILLFLAASLGLPGQAAVAQSSAPAVKILVDQDGMYALTGADLAETGAPLDGLAAPNLHLSHLGQEVAIYVSGEDDGLFDADDRLIFFGERNRSRYTNTSVYWLTWDGAPGLRMQAASAAPTDAPIQASFRHTERIEQNLLYQSSRPSGADEDHWYWQIISANSTPVTRDYPFSLTGVAPGGSPARVRGMLYGIAASPYHHTLLSLNGALVDDGYWNASIVYNIDAETGSSNLLEGANTLRLQIPLDGGVTSESMLLNWFEVSYDRLLAATGNALFFEGGAPGARRYQVSGFSAGELSAYDLSDPAAPLRLLDAAVEEVEGSYRLTFQRETPAGARFAVLADAALRAPLSAALDTPSELRNPPGPIDYIMIAPADFLPALQPLAGYHQERGLRVLLADVQDIYDEFGYGQFNPAAIQAFLAFAHDGYPEPAPQYALLAGDGTYDFKDYRSTHEANYIPPYLAMVDPWVGEAAADNRYVTFGDQDILPDMHLGRLPVRSADETAAVVSKILAYARSPEPGSWNASALFAADNSEPDDDFPGLSEAIAARLPASYQAHKVYLGQPYATTAARAEILNQINAGQLLVSYIGHSSVEYWAVENLFGKASLPSLTNGGRLPFFIGMDCLEGNYTHPSAAGQNNSGLAESLVRLPSSGAIAAWSPTGMGASQDHTILEQGLFQAIFQEGITRLGPATTWAKRFLAEHGRPDNELLDTYLLFGDPAMHLNLPGQADLGVQVTLLTPEPVRAFQPILLRVDYANQGARAARQVALQPAALPGLVPFSDPATGEPIPLLPGGGIALPDVPAGGSGSITLQTRVAPSFSGTLPFSFTIYTGSVETLFADNTAGLDLVIEPSLSYYLPLVSRP